MCNRDLYMLHCTVTVSIYNINIFHADIKPKGKEDNNIKEKKMLLFSLVYSEMEESKTLSISIS